MVLGNMEIAILVIWYKNNGLALVSGLDFE